MFYKEYPPHPALARHVACVWAARAPGGGPAHRVLPDNCVDMLWQDDGQAGFAVGMMSSAILVASARPLWTLAVRFKPGMAGLFLALPMQEITDQRADIDLLWERGEAERLTDALWTGDAPVRARLALIERALLRRLRDGGDDGASTGLAQRAIAALEGSGGEVRVAVLAAQLGVSRQHLAAQFRQHVGLSPKLFARICRFRKATAAIKAAPAPDWAQLALACGYFDQSHLIHDFQEFCGSAPERFHFSNPTVA
ncbi:helix-turn-helix domain-containing protein [Duganella sp. FT94W]|uniref:Helix-turn-helix domain-containing protein n=1 Tax=Duganella lactea TaxID=2692173 RepID=A0ABW9V393_9BURK|nr:helix-turn-helix domain-containing protein [Duganella lactea]MYM33693.1 helix-turn-helix domain-containing protein [Duganella lactea]